MNGNEHIPPNAEGNRTNIYKRRLPEEPQIMKAGPPLM